jgi:hypothetical protein
VRPEVGPQGKGYRRADFEEAWEAYCPGQNLARTDSDAFKRPNVPRPVESAQVDGFASVPEATWDGAKHSNLSNNNAGWDAGTLRKPGNGAQSNFAATETPSDDPGGDPGPIPASLRRHRCDHCGGAVGITRNYDWLGRPDGVWLHSQCEASWFDSESPSARRAS